MQFNIKSSLNLRTNAITHLIRYICFVRENKSRFSTQTKCIIRNS